MVSKEDLGRIQDLLAESRNELLIAKKDLSDMESAGLVDEAKELRADIQASELRLTRLESVYGRK